MPTNRKSVLAFVSPMPRRMAENRLYQNVATMPMIITVK